MRCRWAVGAGVLLMVGAAWVAPGHLNCPGEHTGMIGDLDSFLAEMDAAPSTPEEGGPSTVAAVLHGGRPWMARLGARAAGEPGAWAVAGGRAAEVAHAALGVAMPAVGSYVEVAGAPADCREFFLMGVAAACRVTTGTLAQGPAEGPVRMIMRAAGKSTSVAPVPDVVVDAAIRPARLLNRREDILFRVE